MNTTATLQPLSLPLHGIRLIEASAGTGKTWTIAALYLRLVLGQYEAGMPLLPPQILVVTFTKAATAELRERIRVRLAEAAEAFRGQRVPDEYLRGLIAGYADANSRSVAARQLELAAQWMDEAAVHTIHGWSQRMLGQHAFDSGYPFEQSVSNDEGELLGEAVRDYWRQYFFALDREDAEQVTRLWRSPQQLQKAIAPLLRQPADQLRVDGSKPASVDDLAAAIRAVLLPLRTLATQARTTWLTDVDAIEAMLRKAMADGAFKANMMRPENLDGDLAHMRTWADGAAPDATVLARYSQAKLASATKVKFSAPTHAAYAAIDALPPASTSGDSLRPLILAHAAPWIAARVDAAKQRLAQMGYDDMLARLDQALHGVSGERLAQTIAKQYPVALIDEFQDTDPLQWRIFQRIYAGREHTGLLLIGDPKQAIYSFRGADIHTYLQARRRADAPTWTLDTNYRSTHALVHAVNQVFGHAERHSAGAFAFGKGEDALPFLPVNAHGRGERLLLDGETLPAVQLTRVVATEPMSKKDYQLQMAGHASAWLVSLLSAAQRGECGFSSETGDFRPLTLGDIAILVRSGTEADCVRTALRARGLASVYLSDRDSVYASPEAADMLLWLHACAAPGSDRAMRAALATPTLAQDYAALERLNRDETAWEAMGERFRRLHENWLRQGVLAMLHEFLHGFDLPARLLAHPHGERALTNLLHLAELLQQAAATLDGEHALLRHLSNQIAQTGDGQNETADDKIVRLESEAALIKVITIHKSKGLEYPLVLLPFVCAVRETKRGDRFVLHDDDGEPTLDLQPSDETIQSADRVRLQEDLRLLYVALTRARHACWLGIADIKDGQRKASGLHKSAFGHVLGGGDPFDRDSLSAQLRKLCEGQADIHLDDVPEDAGDARHRPSGEPLALQPARSYHGQPIEPWWIASYSALRIASHDAAPRHSAPETAQQEVLAEMTVEQQIAPPQTTTAASGMHAFPRGAEPGTFLHDLLEWAANEGFAASANAPETLQLLIARRCQRRGWSAWTETLTRWLPDFLRTPLPLPDGGNTSLANADVCRAELEFWFEASYVDTQTLDRLVSTQTLGARPRPPLLADRLNGMLKGFIDLVIEHQGRFYIVDYKSNWLGHDASTYTPDAMDASVRHSRYDLQYAIYTLALHRQLRARLPDYNYDRDVGGVLYLYLRGVDGEGHGVHTERLPLALIEAMDALFAEGTPDHA
ncbi:exodeoxyribonuclease V subunit beta [Rhodanobacter sp. T12-5]|uniref:exodeoxyribonuclease V subunit beta n=1 Tax=Rhodanobacter sp. T12-5 TaxID=2024611 RepID=UPI0011ED719F|nr:exodeoxyribonuclease V subunit beta [Rhodanobacter sp. T12-5]KAA0070261.1 exodeoxyribonuclease V subunit beta [Rhodanobacter sp. T12-5]